MVAPKKNQYWQFRTKSGRDKKYVPETLWNKAKSYFQWIDDNPLYEAKAFSSMGVVEVVSLKKMRAMTIKGFCIYADISQATLSHYRTTDSELSEDFINVITRIEEIIYQQKFEGAAANLLHPNLIARDLGLTDKRDITTGGEKIQPSIVAINKESQDKIEELLKLFKDSEE